MQRETAARLTGEASCDVLAFPSCWRIGHARRVADQLARSRTNKEADWVLSRALCTHHDQLVRAGVELVLVDREVADLRDLIHSECLVRNSPWIPATPQSSAGEHGGNAA